MVKNGDSIKLDFQNRLLDLLVGECEFKHHRKAWSPPPQNYRRGYLGRSGEHPYEPIIGRF